MTTPARALRDDDVYDWYYDDAYGAEPAAAAGYTRQHAPHLGLAVAMTSNPVSGDWVIPAAGAALLIMNIHAGPVTVSLPSDEDDDLEVQSRTLTVQPGGVGLLPVPPSVFGYQPVPVVYDGIPDVAYISWR